MVTKSSRCANAVAWLWPVAPATYRADFLQANRRIEGTLFIHPRRPHDAIYQYRCQRRRYPTVH